MEAMTAHLSANYPPELLALRKNEPLITTKSLCLSIIYHEKGVQPFWVTLSGTTERAAVIYDHLVNSYREGLDPADYETELLQTLWNSREPENLARLDTLVPIGALR